MTEKEKRFTLWYDDMDGSDFPVVGKKNANLGEMIKAGIPVSPGFSITIYANEKFLVDTGIKAELEKQLTELGQVTYESAKKASEMAIGLIESAKVPADVEADILANYK